MINRDYSPSERQRRNAETAQARTAFFLGVLVCSIVTVAWHGWLPDRAPIARTPEPPAVVVGKLPPVIVHAPVPRTPKQED